MTRLVIHIGDPKNGSSSIQRNLLEKRWVCNGTSLAYPSDLNAIPLARLLMGEDETTAHRSFSELADWIDQTGAEVAVISAEHFSMVAPERLASVLSATLADRVDGIEVVNYIRPHPGRSLSSYVQRIKTGALDQSFEAFVLKSIKHGRFLYMKRLIGWRNVFGARFIVRPMLRDQLFRGDIVADFLKTVLRREDFELKESSRVNESPSQLHLAVILLVQRELCAADMKTDGRPAIGAGLQQIFAGQGGKGSRPWIPKQLERHLTEAYGLDAAAVDAEFFDAPLLSTALSALKMETRDQPFSIEPADLLGETALRAIAEEARSLAALGAPTLRDWRKGFRNAKRSPGGWNPDDAAHDVDERLARIAAIVAQEQEA